MKPTDEARQSSVTSSRDLALQEGHYARKQMFLKSRLIAWSHQRRFQIGLDLARESGACRVLDYGSGDGTFLALLMRERTRPEWAVGAELEDKVIDDCRKRLGSLHGLAFVRIADMEGAEHTFAYDAVFCMEVFEHMVEPELELTRLKRLLAPAGRLFISVPVETGLSLSIKQCARRMAAWRGLGDYPGSDPYTWEEFWRSVFAGTEQHIRRPVHRDASGIGTHCHKGFNWRVLKRTIESLFVVEALKTSPVVWLPPGLSSQVWFVCRHKGGSQVADGRS